MMGTTLKTHYVLISTAILLSACGSLTPYKAPVIDAEHLSKLPSVSVIEGLQLGTPPALWWTQFGDPQLDDLVKAAWKDNYDVRTAVARLESAREQLQVTQAARLPGASLDTSASHMKQAAVESRSGKTTIVSPVQWQLSLNLELDLFGRVKHSIEASQASVEEREALRNDVRRMILAQVVEGYLELRGTQMLRVCVEEQVDNLLKTLELIRQRESAGSASPAERIRFEAQVLSIRSRLPSLFAQERASRNRLATLTGLRLDAVQLAILDRPFPLVLPNTLITDEPAKLLLRRADVRAADRALAAATAREGMAKADLFPRISLAALLGNSGIAGDWLGGDTARWKESAIASLPLFDAGARRAQLRSASAEVQAAGAKFEKTISTALEEVDSAISSWIQMRRRDAQLNAAHNLAQEGERLTDVRYREGSESMQGVLESKRITLAAQEQLATAKRDLAMATARTYIAIAGGFDLENAH